MASFNLGNVVGLIKSQTPPAKTYVVWGKILNPSFPDLVELNYYDGVTAAWTPITDPTTQHWLRPVIDNTITAPPVTPAEGDRYLIPAAATGVWAGKTDQVATYRSGAWVFQVPLDGFIVSVRTEANKLHDYRGVYGGGGAWVENDFQVPVAPGTYLLATEKGQPLGVCDLDSSGKVTSSRIDGSTLPYVPAISGNWPPGMATVAAALDHLILNIGAGSGAGVNMTQNIPKVAHGFVVGNVLTIDGTGVIVKVTNAATQKPIGVVSSITDVDNFKMVLGGFITGLSGLVAGSIYYVQNTGILSTSLTQLPYMLALNATDGYILGGGGGSQTLAQVLSTGNTAGAQIKNVTDPTDPQDAATRAFVLAQISAQIAALIDSSPGALDTLNELAAALGDDPNFATTVTNQLGLKAPLASPALTGVPTAPTAAPGTNTTQIATTAFVEAVKALLAPLASPTFTGSPAAPTPAIGDNSTKLATTAFIQNELNLGFTDLVIVANAATWDALSAKYSLKYAAAGADWTLTISNPAIFGDLIFQKTISGNLIITIAGAGLTLVAADNLWSDPVDKEITLVGALNSYFRISYIKRNTTLYITSIENFQ